MKIVKLPTNPLFVERAEHFGAVWQVELERGEATQPHQHAKLEEIYCCLEGEGRIYVGEEPHDLTRGGVFLVPRSTDHWLENPSSALMRCLAVESLAQELAEAPPAGALPSIPEGLARLEEQIQTLPSRLDQVEAIQTIVQLFDTAGHLSEQIENAFGLDNEEGVGALARVERRIMEAVVEITRRYQRGIQLGGFGGRLKNL